VKKTIGDKFECMQELEDVDAGSSIGSCPEEMFEDLVDGFKIHCEKCRYWKRKSTYRNCLLCAMYYCVEFPTRCGCALAMNPDVVCNPLVAETCKDWIKKKEG
jgi:hypothetical protein